MGLRPPGWREHFLQAPTPALRSRPPPPAPAFGPRLRPPPPAPASVPLTCRPPAPNRLPLSRLISAQSTSILSEMYCFRAASNEIFLQLFDAVCDYIILKHNETFILRRWCCIFLDRIPKVFGTNQKFYLVIPSAYLYFRSSKQLSLSPMLIITENLLDVIN
jgi:hypothetical protein